MAGIGDISPELQSVAGKSSFRIRFRFNQQTGGRRSTTEITKQGRQFATAIIEQVGLEYSEATYQSLQMRIQRALQNDVRNEIEHIARQYAKFIPGSGSQRSPRADLTTIMANRSFTGPAKTEIEALRSAQVGGTYWTPRSRRYLTQKRRLVGHTQWFKYRGDLRTGMAKGSTWINAFGPISVRVVRTKSTSSVGGSLDFGGDSRTTQTANTLSYGTTGTFSVARIEVNAFGKITPAMLPALISGRMDAPIPKDGRDTGLMSLVGDADLEMAYRLSGDQSFVPYRPTLEPFLAFALTRAIPTAVFGRIAAASETGIMGTRRSGRSLSDSMVMRNYAWR